jgi:flagellar assembly protein FliH
MSSRAKLVDLAPRPYEWFIAQEVPMLPPAIVASMDIPDEPSLPDEPTPPAVALLNEQRLAEIERDAFTKGYDEGTRAGTAAAGQQAVELLRHLAETIEGLSSTKQDMIRRTERQVVELAMAIAKQMLQREITADRGLLLAMARVALDGLGDSEAATVRLHPDDYALVKAAPDQAWTSEQVTIVADSTVERGGCVVQCDAGVMKVGLDSQFTELARTLLGEQGGDADRPEAHRDTTDPS